MKTTRDSILPAFVRGNVLVIGDTIVDVFHQGTPLGVSAETPTPVVKHEHSRTSLGGAGFLVRNMLALGGSVTFLSLTGSDEFASEINNMKHKKLTKFLLREPGRITTVKERFWSGGHKLLAWDRVDNRPISTHTEKKVLSYIRKNIASFGRIIISDYRHGFLTKKVACALVAIARTAHTPIYVDSQVSQRTANHRWYKGADMFCLNVKEAKSIDPSFNENRLKSSLLHLKKILDAKHIILKRGEVGSASLIDGILIETPAYRVKVKDTVGAGDAFFAVIALSQTLGKKELTAANMWAARKCTLLGTQTPAIENL